jgi:hypothetical protein
MTAPCIDSEGCKHIYELLQKLQRFNTTLPVQHRILRQLMYDSMHLREGSIHDATPGTFEWIFSKRDEIPEAQPSVDKVGGYGKSHENNYFIVEFGELKLNEDSTSVSNSGQSAHDHQRIEALDEKDVKKGGTIHRDFSKSNGQIGYDHERFYQESRDLQKSASAQFLWWLKSGKGIFHICRKAESGKSTLMKYIRRQAQTRHELEQWAGCKSLVLAHFYFSSNTGDTSQMSIDNLRTSIVRYSLSVCRNVQN